MTKPDFDLEIPRLGTHSAKWDLMKGLYGVDPNAGGIAMWVADMDFRPPAVVQDALERMTGHGIYGYFGDESAYTDAIAWWMETRHDWQVEPEWIFTTHGLVNGTALCVDTFTEPGDTVLLMTPVYHAFHRVLKAAGRPIMECALARDGAKYVLDIPAWEAQMTGGEKMLILCSPHNPGGRVWSHEELEDIAAFCRRHDLILVSDEIHHDIVMPGHRHVPMSKIAGIQDRLIMMTATTKTFNIAGTHSGNVIIADPELRKRFAARMAALGISPNSFGLEMATAAYSPAGAVWVDALVAYLDENRRLFDATIAEIPGLASMPLEATYLAWVDFSGTGMDKQEYVHRVQDIAQIAPNHGQTFGKGGEDFLRFNFATQRRVVEDACTRLKTVFRDLQ